MLGLTDATARTLPVAIVSISICLAFAATNTICLPLGEMLKLSTMFEIPGTRCSRPPDALTSQTPSVKCLARAAAAPTEGPNPPVATRIRRPRTCHHNGPDNRNDDQQSKSLTHPHDDLPSLVPAHTLSTTASPRIRRSPRPTPTQANTTAFLPR